MHVGAYGLWGGGGRGPLPGIIRGYGIGKSAVGIYSGAYDRLSCTNLVDVPVATIPDLHRQLYHLAGTVIESQLQLDRHHGVAEIAQRNLRAPVRLLLHPFHRLIEGRSGIKKAAPEPREVAARDLLYSAEKVGRLGMLEGPTPGILPECAVEHFRTEHLLPQRQERD